MDTGNVVEFPIKRPSIGMIKSHHMKVECLKCGNTDKFYGKAVTQPFIVVEKAEHDEFKYNVTEVGYTQSGFVDELIETCAECGSKEVDIQLLKKDSM